MRFVPRSATLFLSVFVALPGAAVADDPAVSIYMVGDSYLTSYGVPAAQSFDVQLQTALEVAGLATRVTDTGFKQRTENGLSLIKVPDAAKRMFASPPNNAVVVELGSNDCGDPELIQPDQDHPTAKCDAIAVAGMLPLVIELVARAKQP